MKACVIECFSSGFPSASGLREQPRFACATRARAVSRRKSERLADHGALGFTLIELMIVVAVVALLTSVAYPAYTEYVTRGKLVEGTSTLSDGRVKMEQFFQDNRTYVGGPAPAATTNFTYAVSALALTTYTITATGIGGAAGFVYTIDQTNTKRTTAAPSGWAKTGMPGTPATCWITRKGGVC